MRLIRLGLLCLILALPCQILAEAAAEIPVALNNQKIWVQIEETVVPLRRDISRNGDIVGFARKGQVLAVEKSTEHWVKVRANDTLVGWVAATSVSASGPAVVWDPETVKTTFLISAGLGMCVFLYLLVSLERKRRRESQARARQGIVDAKRRLQNRIHVLLRSEPRIPSRLAMDEVDLMENLHSIGYVATLEKDPENFLASCKACKPNLVLTGFEFQSIVEAAMRTEAVLINTPVVYLQCESIPVSPKNRVRAYLEKHATDKELGDAIALCLKKSPDKILHSVKQTALKGAIYTETLIELFHFIASVKKTGRLLVVSGSDSAEVHFLLGNITKAKSKALSGTKAVEAILDLISGTFEFHEKEPVADGNAGLNTERILMDWARNRDESKHYPRT